MLSSPWRRVRLHSHPLVCWNWTCLVPTRWSSVWYMIERCAAVIVVWHPFQGGYSCYVWYCIGLWMVVFYFSDCWYCSHTFMSIHSSTLSTYRPLSYQIGMHWRLYMRCWASHETRRSGWRVNIFQQGRVPSSIYSDLFASWANGPLQTRSQCWALASASLSLWHGRWWIKWWLS